MRELVCRNNDYNDKIEYVPNWCDDFSIVTSTLDIDIPTGFNVMMAGNLGEGIGPEEVMNAIKEIPAKSGINFLFAGGGSRLDFMKDKAKEYRLNNVSS